PEPEPEPIIALAAKPVRDALWDALENELGGASTPTARTNRGKTVKELLAVDATPEDVTARCTEYRRRFPNAALTDSALRKHWDSLPPPPRRRDFLVVDGIVLSGPAAIA